MSILNTHKQIKAARGEACVSCRYVDKTYLELLSCAFTVASGDDGCVDVEETVLLEEQVCGKGKGVPDACYSSNCVGARPEVSLLSQEFKRGLLLGNGVHCCVAVSNVDQGDGFELDCLE